jgi:hypothetical protein
MIILDCNVTLPCMMKKESIRQYMEEYKIRYCGLRSQYAVTYHPLDGNADLWNLVKDYPAILPVFTALPSVGGDFPDEEEFAADVIKKKGIGVYFEPFGDELTKSACLWTMGRYYEVLSSYKLPLMIKAEKISFHVIYELSKSYPSLKIVLLDIRYAMIKDLYGLLDATRNLYLETSGLKGYRMIHDICKKYGAVRLVFGSRFPVFEPGTSLADLFYMDVSREEKQIVACNPHVFGDSFQEGGQ